jgi:hypothetical protein
MKKRLLYSFFLVAFALTGLTAQSALETAAASIGPDEWTFFTGPPTDIGKFGISWQAATAFWDHTHKEFQFMAKAQGGGAGSHWIYSEASDSWRATTRDIVPGSANHIWERGFDHDRGDYYFHGHLLNGQVKVMERSVEAGAGTANSPWKNLSMSPPTSPTASPEGGVDFHPNLYGQGDGGVVFSRACARHAWRRSTDTWETFPGHSYYGGGKWWSHTNAAGQYLPGFDRLVVGTGSDRYGYYPLVGYDAGSGGSLNPAGPIYLGNPPVTIRGSTSNSLPWGKLVVHPANDSCLMILEAGPPNRVWVNMIGGAGVDSEDGNSNGWVLESYTHPLYDNLPLADGDAGSWTLGHVFDYGVIWGMAYSGSESKSVLWKPPDSPNVGREKRMPVQDRGIEISASPNPFRTAVAIRLANGVGANNYLPLLPQLALYDIHGRMVHRAHASHTVWNAAGLPAGIYLVKVQAGNKTYTKRIILQK